MKNKFIQIVITLFVTSSMLSITSYAQVGSLDLSFDNDGIVTTDIGSYFDGASSVAVQSDGKIVVAGSSYNTPFADFAVARYNTNGSLDSSFDADGKVITVVGSTHDYALSVAIQSDGKIVLAGWTQNGSSTNFALVRYHTNGSLDSSFDADGIVTTTIESGDNRGNSVIIQTDGKILLAGFSSNGFNKNFCLVRYHTNGSLDTGFDTDGKVTTDFGSPTEEGHSIALQTDGKIIVAGTSALSVTNTDFALVRYNTNGSIDTSFDSDGKVITDILGNAFDEAYSVAIQTDGKIVAAGYSGNGTNNDFALVRYNSNGSLDNNFDTDGKVTTPIGTLGDYGKSIAIQTDGKIIVGGYSVNGTSEDFALARYNIDGSLDIGFDSDGKVTTAIGNSTDRVFSVAIQGDGKILVAGYSDNSTYSDFAVARYNNICTPIVSSQSSTICAGQSVNVGSNTYSISGTYIDTLTSVISGCDSLVTTNLTVLSANIFTQSLTICAGQSVSVGSNIYNASGTFTDTLLAVSSCDSIVTTNLVVHPMPTLTTSMIGNMVTSNQVAAVYQWTDCNNGNLPIAGETNQSFTPTINGNYAVIVTLGSCTDTSACVNIQSVGVFDALPNDVAQILIYPNPFSSSTILQADNLLKNVTLNVYNLFGQQVKQINNLYGHTITLYRDNLPNGLYFIWLKQSNKIISRNKLVITD